MTDELKQLKKTFDAEPEIKASDRAKKMAMTAAMQAFENHHEIEGAVENKHTQIKEKVKSHQGNSSETRQKDKGSNDTASLILSYWRKLMKYSYIIPVGAAAALAVSVFVLKPQLSNPEMKEGIVADESTQVATTAQINARIKAKKEATEFLTNEMEKAKKSLQESEEKLVQYEKKTGVINTDPSEIVSKLKVVNNAYVEAKKNRINAEQELRQLAVSSGTVKESTQVVRQEQKTQLSAALQKENALKQELSKAKSKLMNSRSSSVGHVTLEREVASNREIYEGLQRRAKEVAVASVDPSSPNMILDYSAGMEAEYKAISKPQPQVQFQSQVQAIPQPSNDKFQTVETSSVKLAKKDPVSTFSIDVDTASYGFMRAALKRNALPQKEAIRVEELINYFPYDYPQPTNSDQPFQVSTTVMPTPWNANTKLLHIGIKGYTLPKQANPKSNLVFLLDTSGSMNQPNKLPLLKDSFKLLLSTLQPEDTVSIVAYAGSAGTVLEPTKVQNKAAIIQALERLNAGGSTAGGAGIQLAYQLAEANYDKNAVNRVILATDGDFNVGINNQDELKSYIEKKRQSGVYLSVLGFGMGNYNDALMQTLAQNGNGNAAYIDSLSEARKVLIEEASSTLFTIAKDVKIQMEFNPKAVSEYRLIGYETRALKREDFNNDTVDAGDIGAGHTVTAIYEITPFGAENSQVDPLRYGNKQSTEPEAKQSEYGFLKLRYKLPNEDKSKLIQTPIRIANTTMDMNTVSAETRFATAVAAFGQMLRGGNYMGSYRYDDVMALAQQSKGQDPFGYRAEFISLVRLAKTIQSLR